MLNQPHQFRNLTDLLETRANQSPQRPMYSFLDRQLDCKVTRCYGEFFENAKRFAVELQSAGLSRSPVLLLQPDPEEFVLSFWACILAGVWPMPYVRPRGYRWSQLGILLSQSGASALITTSGIAKLIPAQTLADITVVSSDMRCSSTEDKRLQWIRPRTDKDDVAFIQYTSGSTSRPRGVVITHGNILNNLESIHRDFACSETDIGLGWLPLHHDMGLVGHVLQPCYSGIHNYFMRAADFSGNPLCWLQAIHRYRATISGGPCFAYALSLQPRSVTVSARAGFDPSILDLSCWRLAYCGSQKVVPAILKRFESRFVGSGFRPDAWFPCYGLAESTLYVGGIQGLHTTQRSDQAEPFAAIARVGDGAADIKIVDPVTGLVCADNKAGEIWISSLSVSPGYYRHSAQSKRYFDQAIADQLFSGSGNYFRTGDLGFVRDGKLYFSGRQRNVLKIRGRCIHGEDIETLIQHEGSDLGISQCVVVPHNVDYDETFSLLIECSGQRSVPMKSERSAIESRIRNLVCDTFSVLPHRIMFLERGSLPMTTSGKAARSACWALLQHHLDHESQGVRDVLGADSLDRLTGVDTHARIA